MIAPSPGRPEDRSNGDLGSTATIARRAAELLGRLGERSRNDEDVTRRIESPPRVEPPSPIETPPRVGSLPTTSALPIEPLAVDAKQLAAMLGLSVRTIRAMDAAGKLPKPLRLNAHAVRWSVRELTDWIDAGAPERRIWKTIREARR